MLFIFFLLFAGLMECREATNEEWDLAIKLISTSTFFHSRQWLSIWENIYPNCGAKCYYFNCNDGQEIYLPGLQRKLFRNLVSRFDSSVVGTYGGLLSLQSISSTKYQTVFDFLKGKMSFYITQNSSPSSFGLPHLKPMDETYIVDISNWSEDQQNYSTSAISQLKKTNKIGLLVREVKNLNEWKDYYALYQESSLRWGKSKETLYPFKLFEKIMNLPENVHKLWLVYDGKIPVYGCLVFFHHKTAYHWHGSGSNEGLTKGASYLLQDHIIRYLKEKGFDYYDMMSNGGNDSLKIFKSKFRPSFLPIYESIYKRGTYRFLEGVSRLNQRLFGR
ncbi:MAG: GNAT family N-acetyltransferase [Saprospiraceae bacterium]